MANVEGGKKIMTHSGTDLKAKAIRDNTIKHIKLKNQTGHKVKTQKISSPRAREKQ